MAAPIVKRGWLISSHSSNIRDDYRFIGKPIGQGTYGVVRIAQRIDSTDPNEKRAIKIIPKNRVSRKDVLTREINIMKQLDHPNIVKVYETYEDDRYLFIVMELCKGGELFDFLIQSGSFTEELAATYCRQMLSALSYLHAHNIAHRDLKPENFLIVDDFDNTHIKLIDFGFAKNMSVNNGMNTRAGTAYYISPEVLTGIYTEKCDVWSIGVILYMMLSGYPPFDGQDDAAIINQVKTGRFTFSQPIWSSVSKEAKDLISNMLKPVPATRISASDALNHGWFSMFINSPGLPLQVDISTLRAYQTFTQFKRAVISYIATQCSESEVSEFVELFTRIDRNNDGVLSVQEFSSVLEQMNVSNREIQQLISAIDTSHTGSIDYTEFLAATLSRRIYLNEEKLHHAFRRFDVNQSGRISIEDLRGVLDQENLNRDSGIWEQMIDEVDINGDGEIDFEEFLNMMHTNMIESTSPLIKGRFSLEPEFPEQVQFQRSKQLKQQDLFFSNIIRISFIEFISHYFYNYNCFQQSNNLSKI